MAYIIVLYGFNDIRTLKVNSNDIISVYKQIIKEAHKNKIIIYAGTILPFGNDEDWTKEKEIIRQKVTNWIRNTKSDNGWFDGFFDFDKIIKDPNEIFRKNWGGADNFGI